MAGIKGESKKWIQKAIQHPGALHRQMGIPAGQKIPAKKLASTEKRLKSKEHRTAAESTELRRINLAQTLKGFNCGTVGEKEKY